MELSESRLLELHVEALFTHDAAGRIVAINEPGGGPAPRFYLGRTRLGTLWRVQHDVPAATARRLEALATAEPVPDDLRTEPRTLAGFAEALRADQEVATVWAGPAYHFPATLEEPAAAPAVTRVTRASLHLLRRMNWDPAALTREFERWEPMLAVVEEEGAAVALCFSSRLTTHAAEAGVETLAGFRGRGYASAVVSAWAGIVRAEGRVPLYDTSSENRASQAVARKLGLIQYGADLSLG